MAIYSKKTKDPTEVALSAIQDALNIKDADSKASSGPPAMIDAAGDAPTEGRRRNVRAPKETPFDPPLPGRDDRDIVQAANDDQASIGQFLQSLQRQPSRTPFIIATLFAATWAISALGLMFGFGGQLRELITDG